MKAWRLTMSDHSLELEDISDPSPRDGSILVRVQASSQPLLTPTTVTKKNRRPRAAATTSGTRPPRSRPAAATSVWSSPPMASWCSSGWGESVEEGDTRSQGNLAGLAPRSRTIRG
ncbi:MAG: hypothetical protein QOD01_1772 [Actinomycetota bacterium]|jgi:hypothetical protein|nr:hypothetical protein [Actinomycetota bacterium]